MRYPGPVYSVPEQGFPNTRPGFSGCVCERRLGLGIAWRPRPGSRSPRPGQPAALPAPGGIPLSGPRCAALGKIAMGITMGYMLILML